MKYKLTRLEPYFISQITVGLLVILASLLPFYILGPYSAIGAYDEADLGIPFFVQLGRVSEAVNSYWYEIAGGSPFFTHTPYLTAIVNPNIILFETFPPWVAALSLRFLDYLITFYYTLKLNKHLGFKYTGSILIIITLTEVYAQHGWQLGSLEFLTAIVVAFIYFIHLYNDKKTAHIFDQALIILLIGFFSNPIFSLPLIFILYTGFAISSPQNSFIFSKKYFPLLFLLLLITITNWHQILVFQQTIAPDSSRYLNFGGIGIKWRNTPEITATGIDFLSEYYNHLTTKSGINSFYNKYPTKTAFIASILILAINIKSIVPRIILSSLAINIALITISQLNPETIIGRIRFETNLIYLFYSVIVTATAILISKITKNHNTCKNIKNIAFILIIACLLLNIVKGQSVVRINKVNQTFSELQKFGGWSVTDIKSLKEFDFNNKSVISYGYLPKAFIAPLNGVAQFDGMRPNFTTYRTAYIKYIMFDNHYGPVHTHRQFLNRKNSFDQINLKALSFINVGYVLSNIKLEQNDLELKKIINEEKYSQRCNLICTDKLNKITISPRIYIYQIKNLKTRGIVYIPSDIKLIQHDTLTLEYLKSVKQSIYGESVSISLSSLKTKDIEDIKKAKAGYKKLDPVMDNVSITVYNIKKSTPVVFNIENSRLWQGYCDDKKTEAYKVNLIQTMLITPKECKILKLKLKPFL